MRPNPVDALAEEIQKRGFSKEGRLAEFRQRRRSELRRKTEAPAQRAPWVSTRAAALRVRPCRRRCRPVGAGPVARPPAPAPQAHRIKPPPQPRTHKSPSSLPSLASSSVSSEEIFFYGYERRGLPWGAVQRGGGDRRRVPIVSERARGGKGAAA